MEQLDCYQWPTNVYRLWVQWLCATAKLKLSMTLSTQCDAVRSPIERLRTGFGSDADRIALQGSMV